MFSFQISMETGEMPKQLINDDGNITGLKTEEIFITLIFSPLCNSRGKTITITQRHESYCSHYRDGGTYLKKVYCKSSGN